jgi:hypothetical protein
VCALRSLCARTTKVCKARAQEVRARGARREVRGARGGGQGVPRLLEHMRFHLAGRWCQSLYLHRGVSKLFRTTPNFSAGVILRASRLFQNILSRE